MALVPMKKLLDAAAKAGSTVGAFNISSIENICGILSAAENLNAPIIMQIAQHRLATTPLPMLTKAALAAIEASPLEVALNLDHGTNPDTIRQALDLGFSSVMYDGSSLPADENIRNTIEIVKMAAPYGASVEGEIGAVGRPETGVAAACTDPEEAVRFARETGVDALAVGIGNAHGVYAGTPTFHFEVLDAIRAQIDTPLVLHGGTGGGVDNFIHCIKSGVRKINIATATFRACAKAAKAVEEDNWFKMSAAITEASRQTADEHLRIFLGLI